MRIRVLSDLHISPSRGFHVKPVDCDVVVLAGDLGEGVRGLDWARASFTQPIVAIAGNHEFYGGHWTKTLDALRAKAIEEDIVFLENDTVVIEGVRFVGATLWTDFLYFGRQSLNHSKRVAKGQMNDTAYIKKAKPLPPGILARNATMPISVNDTVARFDVSVAAIETTLHTPFDGPTVVVSHHLPHRGSVAPQYLNDPCTPAFASDLSALIERYQPTLWIHGHTHANADYRVGATRIVCNPRGYTSIHRPPENIGFDPDLVIEI